MVTSRSALGQIAWQAGAVNTSFDTRYVSFSQAVPPAPNVPPSVVLSVADSFVVAGSTTTFVVTGGDPDGFVLAYIWTFEDGTRVIDTRPVFWHVFSDTTGKSTVVLEVVDNRGTRTSTSVTKSVVSTAPDCGC